MATPYYFNVVVDYEDARGNLTGDQDIFRFYSTDVAGAFAATGVLGAGNNFVFTRAPGRLRDVIAAMAAAASTTKALQLVVNNLARNIVLSTDAQVAAATRSNIGLRLAAGSQIQWLTVA
jgi:hypothetical protein